MVDWVLFDKYFKPHEVECRCGLLTCPAPKRLEPIFAANLLATRIELGEVMAMSSGIRCPFQNKKAKGTDNSHHLRANAGDIRSLSGAYNYRLMNCAIKNGILGIGVNKLFMHLDGRTTPDGQPVLFGY